MEPNRNYYGHGGRGRGRGGRGHHRHFRDGGGGGGGYHGGGGHRGGQPYRGRGGGNPNRGNRFGGQTQVDPEVALFREMASVISRVGEFQNLRSAENGTLRQVEYTTASNINDLLPILCAPDKLDFFLRYNPEAEKAEEKVGKLVHLVVSCVAALPMQTPCYAALTLAVHEQIKGNTPFEGFATRCIQYVMLQISKELDTTLLTPNAAAPRSTCRLKLYLRYLCILGKIGMVMPYEAETTVDPNQMSLVGFMSVLVDAASAATEQFNNPAVGYWLALVVLSTVPYLTEFANVHPDVVEDKILKPLGQLLSSYKSSFTPGTGMTALLLREPQAEEGDDAEEDDEGDDDEADESGQICDSLQDLLRATTSWCKEGRSSRFALPMDAPWKGISLRTSPNMESDNESESSPITFTDNPLYLRFPQECQLLNLLLSGGSDSPLRLQYFSLEGAVFGRLPIFGSPPDPEDEDDEEEEMEDGGTKNHQLEAFRSMSLLDRYFVAESLRDCLVSQESHVTPSGLHFGSAKSAAEELLRLSHIFSEGEDATSTGIEYAILETIFALLAQSNEHSALRRSYLSRVLLELVRLEPSRISQALMIAMTNLFQDYLPALVPTARDNFSSWFSFHLTNTDYQWPSAYWQLWEPFGTSQQSSSRGEFVRNVIHSMAENTCDPTVIIKQALGASAQSFAKELMGRPLLAFEESSALWLEKEVHRRLWEAQESPPSLLDYLLSDEVTSALGSVGSAFCRTDALIRVILDPAYQVHETTKTVLDKASQGVLGDDDEMEDDSMFSKDVYVLITTALQTYKSTLVGILEKDADALGGDKEIALSQVGAYLLRRTESLLYWNSALLESFLVSALQHRVVEASSVFKWVLRDDGVSAMAPVLRGWSKHAIAAVRETVLSTISDETLGGIMKVDDDDSDHALATSLLVKVGRLLQYSVQRACTIMSETHFDAKKLHPVHVDILEGMKALLFASKHILRSALLPAVGTYSATPASDIEELLAKSDLTGGALASLCPDDASSAAVVLLIRSLELA